jgi:hypothetical protein
MVHPDRALRSGRRPPPRSPAHADPSRRRPRARVDLLAREAQRAALRVRTQAPGLRVVRTGTDLEGAAHGVDPRPRQRRRSRQPAGESPDRLSELRGDARHPLRTQTRTPARGAPVQAMRPHVHAEGPSAAVLLPRLRSALGSLGALPAGRAPGRTSAVRAARRRDRGDELVRGRAQVRRLRQRDPQVGPGVRAGAGVSRGGRGGGRRGPRPSRGGRGRGGRRRASGRSAGGWRGRRGRRRRWA